MEDISPCYRRKKKSPKRATLRVTGKRAEVKILIRKLPTKGGEGVVGRGLSEQKSGGKGV